MKRTLSLVLALVMVLGSFGAAFAADAETTDELSAGAFLETVGVLEGDDDGNLMLDKTLLRRDMVILLSRLMGAEETAAEFPSESLAFEDITDAYYNGYIAWSVNNGLIEGHSETVFGFNENVTAQQYVTVLMRALGYEVADEDYAAVLETAAELGLCEGLEVENEDEILRGQMAVMTLNTLGTEMKDSEVTLAEDLGIEMPEPEVTEATKVENVSADNLKEIVVEFDGEVERDSAELEVNYSVNKDMEINKVRANEDNTGVVISLETKMKNQKEYELTVRNIKTAEGKLNTETIKFTPVDRAIPEVEAVEGLGDKAVKVTFTEPVQKVASSNFKIDGKTFVGSIDQDKYGSNVVILKLYKKLSEETHEIEIKNVKDFADYVMVTTEMEFEVVEDNEDPTIESVNATLEYVTVTFSEPVQESTVRSGSYAYWKATESTTAKNKSDSAKPEKLSDTTYKYAFVNKPLPGYSAYLYIEGVKDYSDNTIAKDSPILVNAEVDQTRPEVVSVKVNDDNDEITVKFTKDISKKTAEDRDNYKLLDEDDKKVSFRRPTVDGKTVTIELGKDLEKGDYTLKIEGLQDITALKNTMMPYSTEIQVGYSDAPEASGVKISGRTIYVTFNNKMTIDGSYGVGNLDNYSIEYVKNGNTKRISLPEDTEISVYDDGKTVIITLPEKIDDKVVGTDITVTKVYVQSVKDIDGNMLVSTGEEIKNEIEKLQVKEATLKEKKLIEIKFNKTIQDFNSNKVKLVKGNNTKDLISYARVTDGKLVIDLDEDLYSVKDLKLIATDSESFDLFQDQKAGLENVYEFTKANKAEDKVAPELDEDHDDEFTTSGNEIHIVFTEDIATDAVDLYAGQFEVERVEDGEDVAPTAYKVEVRDNVVVIILGQKAFDKEAANFSITLKEDSYVRDLFDNAAKAFENIQTDKQMLKSNAPEKLTK
jgi:methionine-rich copper-binding protein CopC